MTQEQINNIPIEMKELNNWANFDFKTKAPINSRSEYFAKSNDPYTWSSFEQALSKADKYGGIGFFFPDTGWCGVDLDNASEGLISTFLSELDTYAEYSKSGKGIHIYAKSSFVLTDENYKRKNNIEMYNKKRFFIVTGNRVSKQTHVKDCTSDLKFLHSIYLGNLPKPVEIKPSKFDTKLSDSEVIEKAYSSKQGNTFWELYQGGWCNFESQSQADIALMSMLLFWCGGDRFQADRIFRGSRLYRRKWDEKRGARTYGQMTIDNALRGKNDFYDPSDYYKR